MASQGSSASVVAAPCPQQGRGQQQPLMMPCPRQEGRKAQRDILCTPGLITAFIILPKPRGQPAPVPRVLLQLLSV